MSDTLSCIVCDKELENVGLDSENQPYEGTTFMTYGHYGSTVFDPMDGSYLEINVCDDCLTALASKSVLAGRNRRPVICEGLVVGWEHVDRPLVPFNPEVMGAPDEQDRLEVYPKELGAEEITFTHEGRQRIVWNDNAVKAIKERA